MKLSKNNKTFVPQKDSLERKWWLINAEGVVLGRLASRVANILRGKNKANYTPFFDTGDFVVVVNADKVKLTGHKEEQKMYYRYSGYMGGMKEISYKHMLAKHPDRILTLAVRGMLPKNRLNRKILKKLKVYAGAEHKHQAQKPETLKVE
ncbi:MAG TPA: 50S ribosomal protein L13 [Candidatus Deferrimicrobium sp.]|nr:50S ribosomal protein L13 [Candidatus Kapabacteria bacterium]HLP60285.1 50S ribosomal protein L13 [Candidatus Deferrimicrobium sp.]